MPDKVSLKELWGRYNRTPFDPCPTRAEWCAVLSIVEAARTHEAARVAFEGSKHTENDSEFSGLVAASFESRKALRAALAQVEE